MQCVKLKTENVISGDKKLKKNNTFINFRNSRRNFRNSREFLPEIQHIRIPGNGLNTYALR